MLQEDIDNLVGTVSDQLGEGMQSFGLEELKIKVICVNKEFAEFEFEWEAKTYVNEN
jgi:hypothetical protein